MNGPALGVTSTAFWLATLLGILLVVPWGEKRPRELALALLNLGFLWWLQRGWVVLTLVLLGASHLALLRIAGARSLARLTFAASVAGVLLLFLLCRTPALSAQLPRGLSAFAASFGYAYVALRLLDELSAVRAGARPPSLVEHVSYLVPFHMLAAGPIQSFAEFQAAPAPERLSFDQAVWAYRRIALGLFKKVVLAHLLERLFLTGFRSHGWYYVLEVQLFLPWLYLDFSSYSDVAVGIGRLLGIATPENFDRPYLARDMIDFWQRWHISLSHWIRRNVFVPLQMVLQRRYLEASPLTTASASLLVAFGLCGLWHQISWRYAAWGLMHALGVVLSNAQQTWLTRRMGRAGYKAYLKRPVPRVVGIVLTFEFVAWSLSFVGGS